MSDVSAAASTTASSLPPASLPTATTLEALKKQKSHSRRLRPPDLQDMPAGAEYRVPLRAETDSKLHRRESRLGLRNLFAKNKAVVHDVRASIADLSGWPLSYHHQHATRSVTTLSRDAAPSPLQRPPAPASAPPSSSAASPIPFLARAGLSKPSPATPSAAKPRKSSPPVNSRTPVPSRSGRGSLATWDPPPLFQAYPQAIKHAALPSCSTPVDTLLRLQGARGGSISGSEPSLPTDAAEEGSIIEKASDKVRKKHRNTGSVSSLKLDWSTKIYVLVTSGYLLQYAGEGSFDRLPEKILHVGKDSAAFASDLIPGRHWVLQVCSAMESDGSAATDSRSLFSRLPFRGAERRHASTFLMVFENANDMESWITTLRREIEHLGGKKHMSETGKPVPDDLVVQLKGQPSQRTLVVRDPDRFSRVMTPPDLTAYAWQPDSAVFMGGHDTPDVRLEAPAESVDMARDRKPSMDGMSMTNSMASHDGRQLDSLRDSANRLSFISSGQRTMLTSEASSPPCSPVRDSFISSRTDEMLSRPEESPNEARPRPNAAAILDRRRSVQALGASHPLSDFTFPHKATQPIPSSFTVPSTIAAPPPLRTGPAVANNSRTLATSPSLPDLPMPQVQRNQGMVSALMPSPPLSPSPTIPNFSVPHSSSKRFSIVKRCPPLDPPREPAPDPPVVQAQPPAIRTSGRRLPPPALAFSRPLSTVADHTSPMSTSSSMRRYIPDTVPSSPSCGSDVPDTPSLFAPLGPLNSPREQTPHPEAPPRPGHNGEVSVRSSSLAQIQVTVRTGPRRCSSSIFPRNQEVASERTETKRFIMPPRNEVPVAAPVETQRVPLQAKTEDALNGTPRSKSAMGAYRHRPRSPSPPPTSDKIKLQYKRASMYTYPSEVRPQVPAQYATVMSHSSTATELGDASRGRLRMKPEPAYQRSLSKSLVRNSSASRSSFSRRSLPQLLEDPPLPPPTCALPPLPANHYHHASNDSLRL